MTNRSIDWLRAGGASTLRVGATALFAAALLVPFPATPPEASAQSGGPALVVPNLALRTVASELELPTAFAFLDDDELFVIQKGTGTVQHVVDGQVVGTVLDLAVNNASERGLLGLALDPNFDDNGYVYLYWTCTAPPPPADAICSPSAIECPDEPALGADSNDILAVPLLGNRVDRFVWDGTSLDWDLNLVKLRAYQVDGGDCPPPGQGDEEQPPRGNHDGGVITFGADGKLYIIIGDTGRRGWLQNLRFGPKAEQAPPAVSDDQFGGPAPDDAHFTSVIIRINGDGTIPTDNPFYGFTSGEGAEVDENISMIFAYGFRNSFGMTVDPKSGNLWMSENGDSSFDELNLVERGMNSGWLQMQGPSARLQEYKAIETSEQFFGLQQLRYPPTLLADTQAEAFARLVLFPGARFSDPEFAWRYAFPPAGMGFMSGRALGPQYEGDMFVGFASPSPLGGPLFHFNLTGNRRKIGVDDPRLEDRVADNFAPRDMTESESLLFGTGFGIVTDIETGPNGNLFVLSLSNGALYEIYRAQ
jgi:glucose/arabinose dehydrogenase